MGKFVKVRETTASGTLIQKFAYYIPDSVKYYGAYTGPYNAMAEHWLSFILAQNALPQPSDNISPDRSVMLTDGSFTTWPTQCGAPARDVNDLVVGRRFWVSDAKYIEIYQLTKGTDFWTITYRFVNGGLVIGTHTNSALMSKYDTGTANRLTSTIIPLLPYARNGYTFSGNPVSKGIVNGYGFSWLTRSDDMYIAVYSQSNNMPDWLYTFYDDADIVDTNDPYQDIDDSEPSGPAEGVGYPEDDLVPIPGLPSVSVVDTGFVTLFNPSLSQVKALASYMWAGLFDVATFKKLFADPMDCILGFNMLPVAIPNGGTAEVVVGNISTGVSMTKAAGQWVELDCGSVTIDAPFGNYLDWSPYMKYSIYLPYIGTVDLSTDDIMGHTIHLVYHIDVLSCACVAYLEVDSRVMYQWTGSCGYSIPVTGENFRQMIANIVNIAANLGGAIATGGMTAPLAIASAASVTQNVMGSKPEVHRSGAIGSSAGMMGMQKPYLIQQGPKICKPEKQYHYLGYPAFVTVQLGNVSGYQEFSNVILDGIPCTEEERDMIAAACAGGIYL